MALGVMKIKSPADFIKNLNSPDLLQAGMQLKQFTHQLLLEDFWHLTIKEN